MWHNLKGNYDVIVFDNKRNLNKFVKAYKEIYKLMEDEEITCAEFDCFADNLAMQIWDNIIKTEEDVYSKDLDDLEMYIDDKKTKINIVEKLDYGV